MMLADLDVGFNPLIIAVVPVVVGGGVFLLKKMSPAMSPMEKARVEQEQKALEEDAVVAAQKGISVEEATAQRLGSQEKPSGYFEQDEVAGSTRF